MQLNLEAAAVLLRCLSYGESAISQDEINNGEAKVILDNIAILRSQACRCIQLHVIAETATKERKI